MRGFEVPERSGDKNTNMLYNPGSDELHECLGITDVRKMEIIAQLEVLVTPVTNVEGVSPTMIYEAAAPIAQTAEEGFLLGLLIANKIKRIRDKQQSIFLGRVHIK